MDQRVAFIADWLRDEWTMTELVERYQISRKSGYKWVARYEADPEHGLWERSQRRTCTAARGATTSAKRSSRCGAGIRTGGEETAGDVGGADADG